jgi:hypothetical protein
VCGLRSQEPVVLSCRAHHSVSESVALQCVWEAVAFCPRISFLWVWGKGVDYRGIGLKSLMPPLSAAVAG